MFGKLQLYQLYQLVISSYDLAICLANSAKVAIELACEITKFSISGCDCLATLFKRSRIRFDEYQKLLNKNENLTQKSKY